MGIGDGKLLAVDIGASNLRVAIAESSGRIVGKKVEHTKVLPQRSTIPDQIAQIALRLLRKYRVSKNDLAGIGIGSVGPIDVHKGVITTTANLPYRNVPLADPLRKQFGAPIAIAGDAVAAALGERRFGRAKKTRNLAYVTISTGIGVGALVDDHLLMGADGNAALLGHMTIDAEPKLLCGCGKRGHWEAYCSARNSPNYARLLIESASLTKRKKLLDVCNGDLIKLTARMLFESAKAGDALAREIVMKIGKLNAMGFANVAVAFNPEMIVVGGALALSHPREILNPIRKWVGRYLLLRPVPEIKLTALGDDVTLYGAIALARDVASQEPR